MPFPHTRSRTMGLPLALGAVLTLAPATMQATTVNAVDLFDEAVAHGLPRTVMLPLSQDDVRVGRVSEGELVIESVLDVELRFPRGARDDMTGKMYLATWQGEQAVLTRSGNHLDISVQGAGTMKVTGFSSGAAGSHHVDTGEGRQREASGTPENEAKATTGARSRRAAATPTVVFWLFLHDDTLDMTRQHIHASYVAWWIADMKRILPTRRLWAIYSQQVAGLTDMPYGHESSLRDWTNAVDGYARREKLPNVPGKFEYKFMLLTSNEVAPGATGLAWLGGHQAMASLKGRYTIVAHEFGHTMNAIHDDAEVRWSSGWPCETNLRSAISPLRANCYRYSATNERRIRAYLANEWTVPVRRNPPDIPRYMID